MTEKELDAVFRAHVNAKRREQYAKNRDRILKRQREYAAAHSEERRAYIKKWHEEHPGMKAKYQKEYEERKKRQNDIR